jgi:hypothetical protein
MLADVLFDAHTAIQQHQYEDPELYAPFVRQLEALKQQMEVLGIALDRVALGEKHHTA